MDVSKLKPGTPAGAPLKPGCEPVVPPLKDMSHIVPFYGLESTQSVIDHGKMSEYVRRVGSVERLKVALLAEMARVVDEPSARDRFIGCIDRQLRLWGQNDAMLGGLADNDPLGHRQAVLVAVWTIPTLVTADLLVRGKTEGSAETDAAVRPWFGRLLREIRAEFTPPAEPREPKWRWLDMVANHLEWGAAAVGTLSVALNDRADFDWAISQLRRGLAAANPDGSLQPELGRGGRALHYHAFALQALGLLVRLADANGVRLSGEEEASLQRIAGFTLKGYNDPGLIEARTGKAQLKAPAQTLWMALLREHFGRTAPTLAAGLDVALREAGSEDPGYTGLIPRWLVPKGL